MPGRCPSCNQVYQDDSLSFCPNDGTPLSKEPAAYPTPGMPTPGGYSNSETIAYQPSSNQQAPPPNWQQPQPPPPYGQQQQPPPPPPPYGQQQQPPPPPYGQQQQQYAPPQYGSAAPRKSSKLPLIIGLLAVVLIGGGIGLYFMLRGNSDSSTSSSNSSSSNSSNTSTNTSTARTTNTTTTTNSATTFPTPATTYPTSSPTTSNTSTTTTTSSYSDDEKHRLFQAAGITRDLTLATEVFKKIGIIDANSQPTSDYAPFLKEHMNWGMKNAAWVQEYNNPQKAREYVNSHL